MKVTLRYSEEATRSMKAIFGEDVIDRVYTNCERLGNPTSTGLGWDACKLVAVLMNGRQVLMSNSEWAYFEKFDSDPYVQAGSRKVYRYELVD